MSCFNAFSCGRRLKIHKFLHSTHGELEQLIHDINFQCNCSKSCTLCGETFRWSSWKSENRNVVSSGSVVEEKGMISATSFAVLSSFLVNFEELDGGRGSIRCYTCLVRKQELILLICTKFCNFMDRLIGRGEGSGFIVFCTFVQNCIFWRIEFQVGE